MRLGRQLGAIAALGLALGACGGKTDGDGQGGSSGSAGSGATGSGGSGGGGGTGAVSGSGGGGGMGAAPAGGSGGCGPIDPGSACDALSEVGCLAAYPRCAPVYDDECCPSCNPNGVCADCVDYRFHECVPFEESNCVPGAIPHCGTTPNWACQGGAAVCAPYGPCNMTPGCTDAALADCSNTESCEPECHAVTAWTCGPSCVPSPVPVCWKGVPEIGPNGPTGYCVRDAVCSATGPCPAEPPIYGSNCASPGAICTWEGFCKPTCECTDGVWACAIPPC